ncbi:hypothetical protein H6G33_13830 [Calothrix sp. FACHB-1219]|nr:MULTISPECIES: hypothetical protein [unclassified Calothrix]MBD2204736.1 hypothetical protein [Calothrix sp. FACHB-168]MBD2218116.1 hypothetical protein [Calothrix sp. FACHB-1219]
MPNAPCPMPHLLHLSLHFYAIAKICLQADNSIFMKMLILKSVAIY